MRKHSDRRGLLAAFLRISWALLIIGACFLAGSPTKMAADGAESVAISGIVRDGAQMPIAGAMVTLKGGRDQYRSQVTDAFGRFVFDGVPAGGTMRLLAERPGYVSGPCHDPFLDCPDGLVLQPSDGQWIRDVHLPILKAGAIAGRVATKEEAVQGATVQLLRHRGLLSAHKWVVESTTTTDSEGNFRFGGLSPGRYVLLVPAFDFSDKESNLGASAAGWVRIPDGYGSAKWIRTNRSVNHDPRAAVRGTIYNDAVDLGAATVLDLTEGREISDLGVILREFSARPVEGRVLGTAVAHVTVRLVSEELMSTSYLADVAVTVTASDGSFVFPRVPTGRYVLLAGFQRSILLASAAKALALPLFPMHPLSELAGRTIVGDPGVGFRVTLDDGAAQGQFGYARVEVSEEGSSQPILIAMTPGAAVRGRVDFESLGPVQSASSLRIAAYSDGADHAPVPHVAEIQLAPDGSFQMTGLPDGSYQLTPQLFPGYLAQEREDGPCRFNVPSSRESDVLCRVIPPAAVHGQLLDSDRRASDGIVIAIPQDWSQRNDALAGMQATRATVGEGFRISNLRPGMYFLVGTSVLPNKLDRDELARLVSGRSPLLLNAPMTSADATIVR